MEAASSDACGSTAANERKGSSTSDEAAVAEEALRELKELLKLNFRNLEQLSKGPAEILPNLLLGSCDDAKHVEVLKQRGVTHVLNCASATVHTGKEFYAPHGIG